MPENLPNIITLVLFCFAGLCPILLVVRRFLSPVRKVKAEVVHKQTMEFISKYSGTKTKYAVVFVANGRRKSFYVSAFSYDGYRVGEKGTLTYQGDRLIDFH